MPERERPPSFAERLHFSGAFRIPFELTDDRPEGAGSFLRSARGNIADNTEGDATPRTDEEIRFAIRRHYRIASFLRGVFAMAIELTIHGTGTGTCSLTGKEGEGMTVSFNDGTVKEAFLSTRAFMELLRMKAGQTKKSSAPTPTAGNIVPAVK